MDALKVFFGSVIGIIFLVLWFFGGIIGAIIAVSNDDALMAVASLLVPCVGAIYTVVTAIGALFG